jgi:hypothetical protein
VFHLPGSFGVILVRDNGRVEFLGAGNEDDVAMLLRESLRRPEIVSATVLRNPDFFPVDEVGAAEKVIRVEGSGLEDFKTATQAIREAMGTQVSPLPPEPYEN